MWLVFYKKSYASIVYMYVYIGDHIDIFQKQLS